MKLTATGGAGFIGSAVIRQYINETDYEVINLDVLTYAENLASLSDIEGRLRCLFEQVDIRNINEFERAFKKFRPMLSCT